MVCTSRRNSCSASFKLLGNESDASRKALAWLLEYIHTRRKKREAPSTPAPDHSNCCSGGAANMTNNRAVSAPYSSIKACGSTPLFLLFDIFSTPPTTTWVFEVSPINLAPLGRPFSSRSNSTSNGLSQVFLPEASSE